MGSRIREQRQMPVILYDFSINNKVLNRCYPSIIMFSEYRRSTIPIMPNNA